MRSIISRPLFLILIVVFASGLLFLRFSCTKKNNNQPTADFGTLTGLNSDRFIKPGGVVYFASKCLGTEPFTVTWWFQGGTPATSTERWPIITYNNEGSYTVKICVNDAYGLDCLEVAGYISVSNSNDIVASK
jgi:hypothetical protein